VRNLWLVVQASLWIGVAAVWWRTRRTSRRAKPETAKLSVKERAEPVLT
jgi:hypothetical protein